MALADIDLALVPPPIDTDPGPEYGNTQRRFQGIPGIERAPNGRLWVTWYAGGADEPGEGPGNYVLLVTSHDDGLSWSKPKLVIDPPEDVRAYDPMLWLDPTGRLWLFWAQSRGTYDGRAGVWCITTDQPGASDPAWSAPRRIANGVAMNKPTVLANGEWHLPIGVWVRPPSSNAPEAFRFNLRDEIGSATWVSTDEGSSWSFRGRADVPNRSFDEHMIVERRDGSLWMLVRTHYGIGQSVSRDGGRTWSPGEPSGIPHVCSRFFIRRLRSGRLLLVRHNPADGAFADGTSGGRRSHLTAYLSDDDGVTWRGGLLLDERYSVSYPEGVEAEDGRLFIVYDHDRKGDREILLAVVTEEDVSAGELVSPGSRLKVLVDKATFEGDGADAR